LYWASPFFQAALSGDWAETGRPASMSSIITISQPPSDPGNRTGETSIPVMTFAPVELGGDEDEKVLDSRKTDTDTTTASDMESSPTRPDAIADARLDSLKKLQGDSQPRSNESDKWSLAKSDKLKIQNPWTRVGNVIPEAVIVLKEERVSSAALQCLRINNRHLQTFRLLHSMTSSSSFIPSKLTSGGVISFGNSRLIT